MNEQEFSEKLKEINKKFYDEIHTPMVDLIKQYVDEHENELYRVTSNHEVIALDDMALLTAWVYDRLHGKKYAYCGGTEYRGSYTKKIRKALGYTM